jgi:hypothetical protein
MIAAIPGRLRSGLSAKKRFRPRRCDGKVSFDWRESSSSQCRRFSSVLAEDHNIIQPKVHDRIFLPTSVKEPFSVPLTLADVYLRDEQLPFAYAFRETLNADKLVSSLSEVVRRYPIIGATADFSHGKIPTLVCGVTDTVPMSFGVSDLTLDEWLADVKSGAMQHVGWQSGGGAPTLSPFFDDLASDKWDWEGILLSDSEESRQIMISKEYTATIRVTYFQGTGTAVGINLNHMVGDANSCFRICQVWGRAMRGLSHPLGASNARAYATLTGMVSSEMALMLDLGADRGSIAQLQEPSQTKPVYSQISNYWDRIFGVKQELLLAQPIVIEEESALTTLNDRDHVYVQLEFSKELLQAMKAYGIIHCNLQKTTSNEPLDKLFVSTNDLITAMGWMMKRSISDKLDWNLSMVVNLRKRGGIDDFGCLEDASLGIGVFGNALTSVVAKFPACKDKDITMAKICNAALAIRQSLTKKMARIEDLQMLSLSGKAVQASNQASCFSSTSWMQFPLWDSIKFSDNALAGGLDGFYGRPSYPLPHGDSYSSINAPSRLGGCTYKLLAPKRHVQSILSLHKRISSQFLTWAKDQPPPSANEEGTTKNNNAAR